MANFSLNYAQVVVIRVSLKDFFPEGAGGELLDTARKRVNDVAAHGPGINPEMQSSRRRVCGPRITRSDRRGKPEGRNGVKESFFPNLLSRPTITRSGSALPPGAGPCKNVPVGLETHTGDGTRKPEVRNQKGSAARGVVVPESPQPQWVPSRTAFPPRDCRGPITPNLSEVWRSWAPERNAG